MSKKAIREFHPMKAVTGTPHPGASGPYKGDAVLLEKREANVPENKNCKVYIDDLPPDVTYTQLLQSIRNCGKIKACHINNRDASHPFSNASVIFFTRAAAERLVDQSGKFRLVDDNTASIPRIIFNRQEVGPEDDTGKSRVLRMTGNAQFVNLDTLTAYFKEKMVFHVEKVETIFSAAGMAQMDWYFSGWYPQAQAAELALANEYPDVADNLRGIKVEIRDDPCDLEKKD